MVIGKGKMGGGTRNSVCMLWGVGVRVVVRKVGLNKVKWESKLS